MSAQRRIRRWTGGSGGGGVGGGCCGGGGPRPVTTWDHPQMGQSRRHRPAERRRVATSAAARRPVSPDRAYRAHQRAAEGTRPDGSGGGWRIRRRSEAPAARRGPTTHCGDRIQHGVMINGVRSGSHSETSGDGSEKMCSPIPNRSFIDI